jgi:secreted Zn-dependent insulinase-like peptidase
MHVSTLQRLRLEMQLGYVVLGYPNPLPSIVQKMKLILSSFCSTKEDTLNITHLHL